MFAGFIASFPSHNDAEYQREGIYGESSCCCSDVDARGGYWVRTEKIREGWMADRASYTDDWIASSYRIYDKVNLALILVIFLKDIVSFYCLIL